MAKWKKGPCKTYWNVNDALFTDDLACITCGWNEVSHNEVKGNGAMAKEAAVVGLSMDAKLDVLIEARLEQAAQIEELKDQLAEINEKLANLSIYGDGYGIEGDVN